MTIAATVATAPLIATASAHVSTASLPANLLALPAVAPAMWLGMLAAIAGQVPGLPVEPLNGLDRAAARLRRPGRALVRPPGWAQVPSSLPGAWGVATAYRSCGGRHGHRAGLGAAPDAALRPPARPRIAAVAVCSLAPGLASGRGTTRASSRAPRGLRVTVLDVGQGDAILLEPPRRAGDPGRRRAARGRPRRKLRGRGRAPRGRGRHPRPVRSRRRHRDLLGAIRSRLVYARPAPGCWAPARPRRGARPERSPRARGRLGDLRLEVLWPPRSLLDARRPGDDPNLLSLVLLARWHGFSMLLTADAEAESMPIDPGPSTCSRSPTTAARTPGLGGLLDRTVPALAVISVGEGNPTAIRLPRPWRRLRAWGPDPAHGPGGDVTNSVVLSLGVSVTG